MAHLTQPVKYNIEDSNIALLGSELEYRVREHAGDKEPAWESAGQSVGTQVWRIEKFHVVPWPEDKIGTFYDGDSYIILHTYKPDPKSDELAYNLHFWLGRSTSQDEAGTAAYKTVELDDHLHGSPTQYREIQDSESSTFLSYFPHFLSLHGGVDTGFHHVSSPPPLDLYRLYRIDTVLVHKASGTSSHFAFRQVSPEQSSLAQGHVFILDHGSSVLQYNMKSASGKVKFKAADFVRTIVEGRQGQCHLTVYDEGETGAGIFFSAVGIDPLPSREDSTESKSTSSPLIFKLSDASGSPTFSPVPSHASCLSSSDTFIVDVSLFPSPAIYVWIGSGASLNERRLAVEYAQRYLHEKKTTGERVNVAISIIRMNEGAEDEAFRHLFEA